MSQLQAIPADNCLRTLDLTGNRLTSEELRLFIAPSRFPHLEELVLTGCNLNDDAARLLCEGRPFRECWRIHGGGNPFGEIARAWLWEHFGQRLELFGMRDPERLYAFRNDQGFTVGFAKDLTQVCVARSKFLTEIVRFDFAGGRLFAEAIEHGSWSESDKLLPQHLSAIDFRSTTIRVRRFETEDYWVHDFPHRTKRELEGRHDFHPSSRLFDWSSWLTQGNHCWANGDTGDVFLNRDGEVIA